MNRLVWFRNDLRLHDNEMLKAAAGHPAARLAFLYVHDERLDSLTPEGHPRTGTFRRTFLAEALHDLREKLRALGADLLCYTGHPATVVPEVCRELQITDLYYSRCTSFDERRAEVAIQSKINAKGTQTHAFQTQTLVCDEDVKDLDLYQPMSFSKRRTLLEKKWPVRPPVSELKDITALSSAQSDSSLVPWDFSNDLHNKVEHGGVRVLGGESAALNCVHDYFWQGDHLRTYKQTRNGLINLNDSSKFSPALAVGCLSPRLLFTEIRRYEVERGSNSSTLSFLHELLWRDHFHYLALRREHRLFTDKVPRDNSSELTMSPKPSSNLKKSFESWCEGRTGNRFIDAAMIELKTTGWLSNRMRQVAASYLIHDLKVDWRMGARWFETCLVDYDPCSNWGNWSYIAGAGAMNQPHVFDVDQQKRMYDPEGVYQAQWVD